MPREKVSKPARQVPENKGLPVNIDAERAVLGCILLDDRLFSHAESQLEDSDFSIQKHRTIFQRMREVNQRGERIDRITVADELMRFNELESVDGLSYLVGLDDGLPQDLKIESYVQRVKEKATLRRIIFASQAMINRCMLEEESPAEILAGGSQTLTKLEVGFSNSAVALNPGKILEQHPGGIYGFMTQAIAPGINCGMPSLDDTLLGFKQQDTYVVAGITGSGKSALAANIATGLAKNGHPGLYIPIEMSREQMLARLICSEAQIPLKGFLKNDLMADQRKRIHVALEYIMDLPLYFDDTPSLTVNELSSRVDRAVMEHGIKYFVLDYLQILDFTNTKGIKFDNENHAIGYASRLCKLLSRRHKISGIILSQLRRSTDNNKSFDRPRLTELRGSGSIENDASVVIFTHREEMGKPGRAELKGKATIIVAKNRMGEKKDLAFEFRGSQVRFVDLDEVPQEQVEA